MIKRKTMLLAAAALSALAFTALPSMAAASHQPPASEAAGHTFSGTSTNTASLYAAGGRTVECESESVTPGLKATVTTEGEFTTDDEGWVKFVFHNCRETTLNSKCTTAGSPEGTITTTTLPFKTTYLKPADEGETHERPGILIEPGAETNEKPHFASFSCVGGFVKITVSGNGILGTVTAPGIGEKSNSMTIDVSATPEGQQHTEDHTGTVWGLESSTNGGAFGPAYENAGSNTVAFAEGFEATTTTETQ